MDFLKEALKLDPAQTWTEEIRTWKKSLSEMRSREIDQNLRIVELDYEKSKLELKVAALIRLLMETKVIDAEKLQGMMAEIDAEDGVEDGRITPEDTRRTPFVASDCVVPDSQDSTADESYRVE